MSETEQIWQQRYADVPEKLQKLQNIGTVATAFNTNIDAIVKISGDYLTQLAAHFALKISDIEKLAFFADIWYNMLNSSDDREEALRSIPFGALRLIRRSSLCSHVRAADL